MEECLLCWPRPRRLERYLRGAGGWMEMNCVLRGELIYGEPGNTVRQESGQTPSRMWSAAPKNNNQDFENKAVIKAYTENFANFVNSYLKISWFGVVWWDPTFCHSSTI